MTFSIVARCVASGRFGVAVASSSPAVAARCAFARAGVGAVATQNITDPSLGPRCLNLMALGAGAPAALEVIVKSTQNVAWRQLAVVDARGGSATYNGLEILGTHAAAGGDEVACAGNLLANEEVPEAMKASFDAATGGDLGDRLVAALRAGLEAGGEAGPVHSAGLVMVDRVSWPVADLRVDWSDDPIGDLGALWQRYKPQLDDYVKRALDPASAPGYGVPGEGRNQ